MDDIVSLPTDVLDIILMQFWRYNHSHSTTLPSATFRSPAPHTPPHVAGGMADCKFTYDMTRVEILVATSSAIPVPNDNCCILPLMYSDRMGGAEPPMAILLIL